MGLSFGGPRCLLEDQQADILYVSGAMSGSVAGVTSPGILTWDGTSFSAMDCGFNWDCVSPLSGGGLANGGIGTMAFWNGELYAGGDIYSINGEPAYNVARWDGSAWHNLGSGLDGLVTRLHGFDDGLYATGYFNNAGGQLAHGLARWDGTQWHSVFDFPLLSGPDLNYIHDVAWYQGQLYVGGNFVDDAGRNCIVRYDGSAWVSVESGIRGSFSLVNLLEVHDDLLYVAGAFGQSGSYGPPDNPGCGIVTWDGEQWGTLGEGTCGSPNPTIYRMSWIQDTLYVTGRFNTIGGVPSGRVAKWDGSRWCSLVPPDYFYPDIVALGSFRDTLIVGGSFTIAGADSIDRIAQWIGGGYTSACGITVGLEDTLPDAANVSVHPNPASTVVFFAGALPLGPLPLMLYDATGRMIRHTVLGPDRTMEIDDLSSGCYVVHLPNQVVLRLVVQR